MERIILWFLFLQDIGLSRRLNTRNATGQESLQWMCLRILVATKCEEKVH